MVDPFPEIDFETGILIVQSILYAPDGHVFFPHPKAHQL
jgi:hypothetical protein